MLILMIFTYAMIDGLAALAGCGDEPTLVAHARGMVWPAVEDSGLQFHSAGPPPVRL